MHVIVLAQGQQKRLPELTHPKHLLRLPRCGGATILERTLRQVWTITPDDTQVTVVGWESHRAWVDGLQGATTPPVWASDLRTVQLRDPGNSSLKGVWRFLDDVGLTVGLANPAKTTVVLLGDVVYSWDCINALLIYPTHPSSYRFVGTSDLSASGGEIWGINWDGDSHRTMVRHLANALRKHPPFSEYQPGQLRRWLWETADSLPGGFLTYAHVVEQRTASGHYIPCDDYTRDIDVPEHVDALPELSELAAQDDVKYGVVW